jgi:hypothetical protein
MTRLCALVLACATTVAYAGPHQVLVLKAEGTADAATRGKVEAQIVGLARQLDAQVEAGEITLAEAAAAVGCNPGEPACKDDVLLTFGVDEVVAIHVTSRGAGHYTVTVRRMGKQGPPRAAAASLAPGQPIDVRIRSELGPLFGVGYSTGPLGGAGASSPPPPATPQPPSTAVTARPRPPDAAPPPPVATPAPASTPPAAMPPPYTYLPETADPPRHSKLPAIGMATGGGLVVLSFLMWGQAQNLQGQIDSAPIATPADFRNLQDLERRADGAAGVGNLFFVAGAVLGGVSAYLYVRDRRRARTRQAQLAPAVFPNGGGITLLIGGAP